MSDTQTAPENPTDAVERFRRTEALFREARAIKDVSVRDAHLAAACGDDDALRSEVEAWLRGHEEAERTAAGNDPASSTLANAAWRDAEAESATTPQQIGRYRIRGVIGTGGMGTVYEAEQDDPKRIVALKLLHPELDDEKLRRRFRTEADVLAHLKHEGIAHVYDVGEIETQLGPRLYIAMERVDGVPLRDYVRGEAPDLNARVRLLLSICRAVGHAHRNGVIHRDLKPSNILVCEDGSPKLLDFGVARRVDVESDLTKTGHIVGTLRYMSPEQALGAHVDSRADVFSLGVIGYEMLAGRHPSEKRTPATGSSAAPMPPLASTNGALRGDLSIVIAKALEREPDDRYQDVGAYAEDLRRVIEGEPILARPRSTAYQLRMFVSRHKALVAAGVTTVLALVLGMVLALGSARREEHERRRADRKAEDAAQAAYLATIKAAAADLTTADPWSARLLLQGLPEDIRGWEWHHMWSRLDGCADRLAIPQGPAGTRPVIEARLNEDRRLVDLRTRHEKLPGWLYERRALGRVLGVNEKVLLPVYDKTADLEVHVPRAGLLWALPEESNRHRLTLTRPPDRTALVGREMGTRLYDMVLSPDQQMLAMAGRDMTIFLLDPVDGAHRTLLRGHTRPVWALTFDATSTQLASGGEDGAIRVWDIARQVPVRTLMGHARRLDQMAFLPDGSGLVSLASDGVRFWDFDAREKLDVLRLPSRRRARFIYDAAVSPDGRRVVTTRFDGQIEITSLETGDVLAARSFKTRWRTVKNFGTRFSPDGRWIAACEGPLHLWDARTGVLQWKADHDLEMGELVFDLSRGEVLAIGESGLHAFALADGSARTVHALPSRDTSVSLDLSPDGSRYAYAIGRTLYVRSRTPDAVQWQADGENLFIQVRWSPDGSRLATASRDGTARLWDSTTGALLHTLRGHEARVYAVAFSPDGTRLASGAHDSTIRLWDTDSGANTLVIRGHEDYIHALVFDPSGQNLVSGSGDGTVRIWSRRPFRGRCDERAELEGARKRMRPFVEQAYAEMGDPGRVLERIETSDLDELSRNAALDLLLVLAPGEKPK